MQKSGQQKWIGILDSGVGGLTIFEQIMKTCPGSPLLYICDNANLPYGPKAEDEVLQCTDSVVSRTMKGHSLELLVVACNTMSTIALPALRKRLPFPVVGVVPAIKPAAQLSKSRKIGLLATPGTIARTYTQGLIDEFAPGCEVRKLGSNLLVELAERKVRGHEIEVGLVQKEIAPLFEGPGADIDTVVLGCTHFPLLVAELTSAAPKGIQWVDSVQAIGNRVKELAPVASDTAEPSHKAVFTALDKSTHELEPYLQYLDVTHFSQI